MSIMDELREAAEAMAAASERLARVAEEAANATPEQVSEVGAAAAASAGIDPFVFQLAIFALAVFVGYYVVWSVTPALHTPLMAVTNAISSVIVVGSLIAMGADGASTVTAAFGFVATILAAVNIFGGFLVTERMLSMYKKKG